MKSGCSAARRRGEEREVVSHKRAKVSFSLSHSHSEPPPQLLTIQSAHPELSDGIAAASLQITASVLAAQSESRNNDGYRTRYIHLWSSKSCRPQRTLSSSARLPALQRRSQGALRAPPECSEAPFGAKSPFKPGFLNQWWPIRFILSRC